MEAALNSGLNRFPLSNFIGLTHFLSGSVIEEQPVGVGTQINRKRTVSSLALAPTLTDPPCVSPSPSPPVKSFD